ncbi:Uncharacterized protein Fot_04139 [Forsythia ovata]|uniref:Uncharacterized protein n=1 Tax=Forsythia ovata TaxID=205694 RepID=A0ABD1XFR2_9LAMI
MPFTDCQEASFASFSSLGFSILSKPRDHVHLMESPHEASAQEIELKAFHKLVVERFHLVGPPPPIPPTREASQFYLTSASLSGPMEITLAASIITTTALLLKFYTFLWV